MPIIKNYGFLWGRRFINRGTGGAGNAGHLKGFAKGKPQADFREQIGVYVLYDKNQHIVYVGQAGNGHDPLFKRLRDHMDDELWNRWEYFTWVGFRAVNSGGRLSNHQSVTSSVSGFRYSDALNEIEGILIEVLEPKLNKQAGRLKGAVEYFQLVDEQVEELKPNELRKLLVGVQSKLDELDKAITAKSKGSAAPKKAAAKKVAAKKTSPKKAAAKKVVPKKVAAAPKKAA